MSGRLVLALWMVRSAESPDDGCIPDALGSLDFLGSL